MMHNRILIIDDDASFRAAQKRLLRKMELEPGQALEVLEADCGRLGMEILSQNQVDCILMDHDMPDGSGMVWLRKILDQLPDQAIVMLTGHGSEQLAVEAMKNGAVDYLVKGAIRREAMERAILHAAEKIKLQKMVDRQRLELIDAERQRVMLESLGAACHHIGQPATVISAYLELMESRETDQEMKDMITACQQASTSINDILKRLMQVSDYRTSPYLPDSEGSDSILDI